MNATAEQIGQPWVLNVSQLSPAAATLALLPFMVHPTDLRRREELSAYLVGQLAVGEGGAISGDLLRALVGAAGAGVGGEVEEVAAAGSMAGDVLRTLLEMSMLGLPAAGLDRAWHIVSEKYRQSLDNDGRRYRSGRDTVRANWKKFRDVSHLWAGLLVLFEGLPEQPSSNCFDGRRLAAVAMGFAALGTARRLPAGDPMLPRSALRLAGVAPVALTLAEPSEWVRSGLQTFTSRNRM